MNRMPLKDQTVDKEYGLLKKQISSIRKTLEDVKKVGGYLRFRYLRDLNKKICKLGIRLKEIKENAERQTSDV